MYEDFSKVSNIAFAIAFAFMFISGAMLSTSIEVSLYCLIIAFFSNAVGVLVVTLKTFFEAANKP